jgi:hypothetical protein
MANLARVIGQAVNRVHKDLGHHNCTVHQHKKDRERCMLMPASDVSKDEPLDDYNRICTVVWVSDDRVTVIYN